MVRLRDGDSQSTGMAVLFKRTLVCRFVVNRKPSQCPNHVTMRPIQFTGDSVIRQSSRVPLHLPDDGTIGGKKLWWRGGITNEVAEVDTCYERVAIGAGQRSGAMSSKIGLQPFENFFLRFHGNLVQNNLLHQENHFETLPLGSSGGKVTRRKPFSQCTNTHSWSRSLRSW